MDSSKGKFASAYKLSKSTVDKKALRLSRRSIEQRHLRNDEVNKRRNLNELSPLQESEASLLQNKSYKGRTPLKRHGKI